VHRLTVNIIFLKQGSYVIVGSVHDVVDPVVEPQYELGPGYQPQEGRRQGQQVITAQKGNIHFIAFDVLRSKAKSTNNSKVSCLTNKSNTK
jgi:hypothetical protein